MSRTRWQDPAILLMRGRMDATGWRRPAPTDRTPPWLPGFTRMLFGPVVGGGQPVAARPGVPARSARRWKAAAVGPSGSAW